MVLVRFLITIIGILGITILMLLFVIIAKTLKLKSAEKIPQLYHQMMLKILGIRVRILGELPVNVPLIVISNHVSWLDILVIGASFPCYFIAKSEIAGWPIFGFLAKMQNTIFVNRTAKGSKVGEQVNEIANALKNNKTIVLFPEGTTSDGNRILKFKSALFAAAKPTDSYSPLVQPICLQYQKIMGLPMTRLHRPFIAWYGNMDLVPHIKGMLPFMPLDVHIQIGKACRYGDFTSRQEMAEYFENTMRAAFGKCNAL